jgi:hypothetical protein
VERNGERKQTWGGIGEEEKWEGCVGFKENDTNY